MKKVTTFQGLLLSVFATLIIDEQDIVLLAPKQIFVVPKEDFFLFKEAKYVSTNEPIHIRALRSTHTNVTLEMIGIKAHCEGQHLPCMIT